MIPVWLQTVHHDGSEKYISNPYPRLGEIVQIRVRAGENAPIKHIYLRTVPDGEQTFARMTRGAIQTPVQWWETTLMVHEPLVHYRFLLQADEEIWWLTAAGPVAYEPLDYTDFRLVADYDAPAWLQDSVVYQIFPDTFANGDPSNDPHPDAYEYRGNRPKTYPWEVPVPVDAPFSTSFYGGDLPGIIQHLDYIQALGINVIYLTPIFSACSNHKYDVHDYTHVDPFLGGDQALIELRQALDQRGMRYLLDIVPNHCGVMHPWFQLAQANRSAPEAEFFTFTNHPDNYHSWLGVKTLVKLNYQSAELRRRMIENPDAIFRRWLKPPFNADGWRIDVANMLGRQGASQINAEIARSIRRAVKETRPDAYLVGENFFDASAQLQGDQWDGVMNYMGLTQPLWNWLRGYRQSAWGMATIMSPGPYSTAAMTATWQMRLAAIPWIIALQQYNIIDSHDTNRIRSMVGSNDALHRLAAIVQFTYPGIPGLFYGDEIGMADVPRYNSRGCMIWDETRWNHDLLAFYRDLIALRRHSQILQTGGLQLLSVQADTFAYQREGLEGRIIVVAHRDKTPLSSMVLPVAHGGVADGTRFVEHFSGQEIGVQQGELHLPEQPQGATLWQEVVV